MLSRVALPIQPMTGYRLLALLLHEVKFVAISRPMNEIRPHTIAMRLIDRWKQLNEQYARKEKKQLDEQNARKEIFEEDMPLLPKVGKQAQAARLRVAGSFGLLTSLANCCCPLPGDEIVGFISRGKGAIIHRADCKNIGRYRERDRERLISVSWVSMGQQRYLAPVLITARDRSGLIRDIATVVSDMGVNMTAVSSTVHAGKEAALISATIEVENLDHLARVITKLEKVRDVRSVERDLGKTRIK